MLKILPFSLYTVSQKSYFLCYLSWYFTTLMVDDMWAVVSWCVGAAFVAGSMLMIQWMQFASFCPTLESLSLLCSSSSSAELRCMSSFPIPTTQQLPQHWLAPIELMFLHLLSAGCCLNMVWWSPTFSVTLWWLWWWELVASRCHLYWTASTLCCSLPLWLCGRVVLAPVAGLQFCATYCSYMSLFMWFWFIWRSSSLCNMRGTVMETIH